MWLFDIFKKKSTPEKKPESSSAIKKSDKLWEMWRAGGVPSPYGELMTYFHEMEKETSKVGGGYYEFFSSLNDESYVDTILKSVSTILPDSGATAVLTDAVNAYKRYKGVSEEELKRILSECDYLYLDDKDDLKTAIEKYAEVSEL